MSNKTRQCIKCHLALSELEWTYSAICTACKETERVKATMMDKVLSGLPLTHGLYQEPKEVILYNPNYKDFALEYLYPDFSDLPDTLQVMLTRRMDEEGRDPRELSDYWQDGSVTLNDEEFDVLKLIRRNGE